MAHGGICRRWEAEVKEGWRPPGGAGGWAPAAAQALAFTCRFTLSVRAVGGPAAPASSASASLTPLPGSAPLGRNALKS